jgi:hypothetical protein
VAVAASGCASSDADRAQILRETSLWVKYGLMRCTETDGTACAGATPDLRAALRMGSMVENYRMYKIQWS